MAVNAEPNVLSHFAASLERCATGARGHPSRLAPLAPQDDVFEVLIT
jgi:hypothetical protein